MKKIILLLSILLAFLFLSHTIYQSISNSKIHNILTGTIYYLERVDGILQLYKANADLSNITLVYSHKGRGLDNLGGFNDNIIDFHYDSLTEITQFIAMNNGEWCLFELKVGETEPVILQRDVMDIYTDYVQPFNGNVEVFTNEGSLYILENGKEELLKKYRGFSNNMFSGYIPIGFSPEGNYLIYYKVKPFLPFLQFINENTPTTKTFIMDLKTNKKADYIDVYQLQWIQN